MMVTLLSSFFVKFFNSFNFFIFLAITSTLFVLIYSIFGFLPSLVCLSLVALLKIFYFTHGIFGFIHVVEDYIFNNICKYFYIILLVLILVRGIIFLI